MPASFAELADESVEGGRKQEAKGGDPDHPEQHSSAEGLRHFRPRSGCHGEREDTEDEGEGGHQNRTKARLGGGRRSLLGRIDAVAEYFGWNAAHHLRHNVDAARAPALMTMGPVL